MSPSKATFYDRWHDSRRSLSRRRRPKAGGKDSLGVISPLLNAQLLITKLDHIWSHDPVRSVPWLNLTSPTHDAPVADIAQDTGNKGVELAEAAFFGRGALMAP